MMFRRTFRTLGSAWLISRLNRAIEVLRVNRPTYPNPLSVWNLMDLFVGELGEG